MGKKANQPNTHTQIKMEGQADRSEMDNSIKLDHQNQGHNSKKVALGPNTRR